MNVKEAIAITQNDTWMVGSRPFGGGGFELTVDGGREVVLPSMLSQLNNKTNIQLVMNLYKYAWLILSVLLLSTEQRKSAANPDLFFLYFSNFFLFFPLFSIFGIKNKINQYNKWVFKWTVGSIQLSLDFKNQTY